MTVGKKLAIASGWSLLLGVFSIVSMGPAIGAPVPPPTGATVVGVAGTDCPSPSFATIQSAISSAAAGATIYVCAGTYDENLTIDKPITLDGAQYDVDARGRDGSAETVINGNGGIVYGSGATSGTINGFTLTGYTGASAEIDATGVGAGWAWVNDVIDVSAGGILMNTGGSSDPAPSTIRSDVFLQASPSAASSGEAGRAVIVSANTGNNVAIEDNVFENLSGPGAAISTPGTAACGPTLDATNFSTNLSITGNAMTEDGASFSDPVNGPGFIDEPFVDLQCTNQASVEDNNVTVTDADDAHAKGALVLSGGDWSTVVQANTLAGGGNTSASAVDLDQSAFPSGVGIRVVDNLISGYGDGIVVGTATQFTIDRNLVAASAVDGIDIASGSSGGSIIDDGVSGSGAEDCLDATTGTQTASTADTWSADGGVTSSPTGLCAVFASPTFTNAANAIATTGQPFSFSITTTGYPTAVLAVRGLPAGLSFTDHQNGTATIAGTPGANTARIHHVWLRATNISRTTSNVALQVLTLQVNRAPVFTSPAYKNAVPGTPFAFTVATTGYPRATLVESGALPTGITFTDDSNGKGTLAGTPASPVSGTWPITFTATSGAGSTMQTFLLTTFQTPVIFTSPLRATAVVSRPFSYRITTSSYAIPMLTASGALPAGVTFVDNHDGTGTIAGTPSATSARRYRILLGATTVAGTDVKSFSLVVESVPSFVSPSDLVVPVGAPFTFTVRVSAYPISTTTVAGALPPGVIATPLAGGDVRISGAGAVAGIWSLTVTSTNVAGSASQTLSLVAH